MSKAAELASLASASETALGNRNIVINGAMQISQRATSVTGIGASSGYFTLDRWTIRTSSSAGRLTMSQDSDSPDEFGNSLKLACTTADTSIAAGEFMFLSTRIEGQDLQQLKKGTSDAESITVSFYVRGNASATYVCELADSDHDRNNTQAFAVTTSWNRITLTFTGDTTGAFADDNALSLQLNFWMHGGSTYTGGTFASNTWASETNANRYAGSRTSFYDSTSRTLSITGVQMEAGPVATPFEHRSYGQELALCERYFQSLVNGELVGSKNTASRMRITAKLEPEMRAVPTVTRTSTNVVFQGVAESLTSTSTTAAQAANSGTKCMAFDLGGFSSLAARSYGGADSSPTSPVFNCDAEL